MSLKVKSEPLEITSSTFIGNFRTSDLLKWKSSAIPVPQEILAKSNLSMNLLLNQYSQGKLTREQFLDALEKQMGPQLDTEATISDETIQKFLAQVQPQDKE